LRDAWLQRRLAEPGGRCRIVIDTDAANEIDDQFALAWALRSEDRLRLEAVYAAPFSFAHRRAALGRPPSDERPFAPPGVGMARSFDEIGRVFDLAGVPRAGRVFRGATGYLAGPRQAQASDAAEHLVALARSLPDDPPLYVLALGCPTNVASALLMAPDIADRIVVVWTSGYPSHAPHPNHSFNLEQDPAASRWLFDSGVPLVYLPGFHVGAQLRLSWPEAEAYLQGRGPLADGLFQLYAHNPLWELAGVRERFAHSWVLWDLICVAWLLNPGWVPSTLVRAPVLDPDLCWRAAPGRHWMREAHAVQRDAIFADLLRAVCRSA
jgi:inosine-uridine nucleoside N-ribohydrolase